MNGNKQTIEEIQKDVVSWANIEFPKRNSMDTFMKLVFEEIPELVNGGMKDPLEYADILILVLDLAYLNGINAGEAIQRKMEINRTREWEQDAVTGVFRHKKEKQ